MNLKKLFKEAGHKAVAQAVLREYSSAVALKRPPKKKNVQILIPEILVNYVKVTARSPGRIGERFEQLILKDMRNLTDEGIKLY